MAAVLETFPNPRPDRSSRRCARSLDDLVAACRPRRMTVTGAFTARGGIKTTVVAEHPRARSQHG